MEISGEDYYFDTMLDDYQEEDTGGVEECGYDDDWIERNRDFC